MWVGSSLDDLREMPDGVRSEFGHALYLAQLGGTPPGAKALAALSGPDVIQLTERYDGDTYRAIYTIRFSDAVYVLHVFQKKASSGIATPQRDIDLIRRRLQLATRMHQAGHRG
jgi:phage-related protein